MDTSGGTPEDDRRPTVVITNSDAGTNDAEALAQAVTGLEAGGEVVVRATGTPKELEDALADVGGGTVVVVGGDGSLHAVVNHLWTTERLDRVVIGLVPLGTGNDFARGAAIPLDPAGAAALVVAHADAPTPVDLVEDDAGSVVVNGVHLGVGAQASRAAEVWKPRLGRLGYAVGAAVAGVRPEFVRVEVTVDGRTVVSADQHVAQVALGNGSTVGGGTELTPEADPSDGQIDVMVSFAVGAVSRLGYLTHLRRGDHHRRNDVLYVRGSRIEVRGPKFWLSADGEITGPHTERSWTLRPGALRMVLPPNPPPKADLPV